MPKAKKYPDTEHLYQVLQRFPDMSDGKDILTWIQRYAEATQDITDDEHPADGAGWATLAKHFLNKFAKYVQEDRAVELPATVYEVRWQNYDGCEEYHSTHEIFSRLEDAQQFEEYLELMSLYWADYEKFKTKYVDSLHSRYKPVRSYATTEDTVKFAIASGIPRAVFAFDEDTAKHAGLPHCDHPLIMREGHTYSIYSLSVRSNMPEVVDPALLSSKAAP